MDNKRNDVAQRAASDLAGAMATLQQVREIFKIIEDAAAAGEKDRPFLLAQVGAAISDAAMQQAESNAEFFREVSHA